MFGSRVYATPACCDGISAAGNGKGGEERRAFDNVGVVG